VRLGGNQKIDLIRRVPLFARCSKPELKEIAMLADEIDLRAGKELTRQGALGREFFVLLEGTADVKKDNRKVNTLGPGDFFGEIALVSREPRTATVISTSPVRALVITDRAFKALLKDVPSLSTKLLASLAARLARD